MGQREASVESIKVLIGDQLRIECPQMNPTWFYRRVSRKNEDLVVTRHGVINVEYKQKITTHPLLKHKIIFINKIDADDDGVYSCLYTKSMQNSFNNYGDESMMPIIQERYSFNVSVYSKFLRFSIFKFIFSSIRRFNKWIVNEH